jgi:hypothetical protein
MTSAGGTQPPPKRVIFIDFGGVISIDEFWLSLRQEGHPLREQVDAGMERVWHAEPGISRAWMRGELGPGGCAQLRLPGLMSIHLNRGRTGSYRRSAGCHWRSHGAQCRTVASMAASHGRENTWR